MLLGAILFYYTINQTITLFRLKYDLDKTKMIEKNFKLLEHYL